MDFKMNLYFTSNTPWYFLDFALLKFIKKISAIEGGGDVTCNAVACIVTS